VLGTGEANALGTEAERGLDRFNRLGVGADFDVAADVGPAEELGNGAADMGLAQLKRTQVDVAVGAVDGDAVATRNSLSPMRQVISAISTLRLRTPATQGLPVTRHHGGVAGHAAAERENARRRLHALDIAGRFR
jgi:hypothetical protein